MKILYLAAANSIHNVRWANILVQQGYEIFLVTLHPNKEDLDKRVQCIKLPIPAPWGYFLNVPFLKKLIKQLRPHLLHVHYATGYGTLGRLSEFQPLILSVWGSDIFEFPYRSKWHRALLTKNLQAAKQICSTSQNMAIETKKYCFDKPIDVVPFGIDVNLFYPCPQRRDETLLKIGTVKTLALSYGIDILIHAFYALYKQLAYHDPVLAQRLRLCIAGEGEQRGALQALVNKLGLSTITAFAGHLPHHLVPAYLNQLHIYVAASRRESFGVAVLEASACGLPVIVSRIGGLPEVVEDNVSGYFIEKGNIRQLTAKLMMLVQNKILRDKMGQAGRQLVLEKYNWQDCVHRLEVVYTHFLSGKTDLSSL
jgi:glycosyltransferase involved in cell wall biosynthesis